MRTELYSQPNAKATIVVAMVSLPVQDRLVNIEAVCARKHHVETQSPRGQSLRTEVVVHSGKSVGVGVTVAAVHVGLQ